MPRGVFGLEHVLRSLESGLWQHAMSAGASRNDVSTAKEQDSSLTAKGFLNQPQKSIGGSAYTSNQWNTHHIQLRVASDAASAACAAGLVAPLITILDRYVDHHYYLDCIKELTFNTSVASLRMLPAAHDS